MLYFMLYAAMGFFVWWFTGVLIRKNIRDLPEERQDEVLALQLKGPRIRFVVAFLWPIYFLALLLKGTFQRKP